MKIIVNMGIEAYGIILAPLGQNMGGKSLKSGKSAGTPALHKPSLRSVWREPASGQLLADPFKLIRFSSKIND
ncbi:MAG: hypothetical protein P9F19_17300 [Candidatus Contendobacter sp.]|nr:hypothetical protein [Candidatus Contendobacter sp.]MDG4559124.1 hypothetical protein [Candidatus Contendobacter sp.]